MSGTLYLCECWCFSCNKCCKCPLRGCQLCLKSVYGVVSRTDLSVVCAQKGSFMASRSLVLLRRACPPPPQVQKFMPHFFPCAFIDSLCSEFWSPWNLPLCSSEMDCPCYCAQDSRFFTGPCLNFPCCFTATVVAIITVMNLGAILVPSTRGWGISLSSFQKDCVGFLIAVTLN